MQRNTPIRFAIALLFAMPFWQAAAQMADASHGKPAPSPTNAAPAAPPQPVVPPTPAQRPPHRADISYSHGQLAVTADNSSLNQILREISRETGITITGGVEDERVFGKYGPSPASEILAALLDGTGSNMFFVQSDASSPGELILTPRHGGPTPPNPNAPGFEDEAAEEAAPSPTPPQEPVAQAPPAPVPPPNVATPETPAPASTPAVSSTATDPNATPTDPNAVKTPQQIFEQLQRMRQPPTPQ